MINNLTNKLSLSSIILVGISVLLISFWTQELFSPFTSYNLAQNKSVEPSIKSIQDSSSLPKTQQSTPAAARKETSFAIPNHSGNQIKIPILMYHYVGNNPNPADRARDVLSIVPEKFDEQMKYLSDNGYVTISLDTLYAALKKQITLPSKPIVLTFDDGYIDFYYNAYPILRKYNFHATEFIPTGLMDQGYYLRWSQIQEMQASGLINFGAHTVHHSTLTSLPSDKIISELRESKAVLQEKLGVPVNFVAFPFGATNNLVIELTKQAGYLGAAGTWSSKIQSEGTIYDMPRIRINGSVSLKTFSELL